MTQSNCLICNNYHVAWPALQFWIIYLPLLTPLCAELKHGMYSQHNPLQMTPAMYLHRQWNTKQKSTVDLRICFETKSSQVVDSTIFLYSPSSILFNIFRCTVESVPSSMNSIGPFRWKVLNDDDDCRRQTMMMIVKD